MSRRLPSVDELAAGVVAGQRAMLGRAITLVESRRPAHRRLAQELLERLLPRTGAARRIGVTGVPGVGKSTFLEGLGARLLEQGHRLAVLAIDPSSAVSGGSILGDKTRMGRLATAEGAFIRPSPTGGSLGGVAAKTRETILVCEAAGYDTIFVETVGVGQSEVLVAEMVDSVLLLLLPGAGDELQGIKRGIVETVDVVAVNKCDGDETSAGRARVEYESALRLFRPGAGSWTPPVLACSGLTGRGLDEVWQALREHRERLESTGVLAEKRRAQRLRWLRSLVDERLHDAFRAHDAVRARLDELERRVADAETTPSRAADELLGIFLGR
ncbi:MAG: methylmalonyl Co-A mutase-associated GTPase MeaB [Acidobacteriota bacterium]